MTDAEACPTTERAAVRQLAGGPCARWSFANTVVARFGTLAIGIVLARLLGPEEFGTFAVAFVALMAILSFNELGRQPGHRALAGRPGGDRPDRQRRSRSA